MVNLSTKNAFLSRQPKVTFMQCYNFSSGVVSNNATSTNVVQFGLKYVSKVFPSAIFYTINGEAAVKIPANYLISFLTFMKRHTATNFTQLRDISAIDYPERKFRFEVVYQLLSISYNQRLTVIVSVPEGSGLDSVVSVYPSAGWYERETWDMFGIFFRNHSDLRRMLTDYGFKGHPLRKDFPVTGFVEVRYNDFRKRILYEKVSLPQEYRLFNLENSWKN